MKNLKGIFPALLTPFDDNGKINEKALEQLIEMNIKKGVDGFYVNGSTAEVFMLNDEERRYLYRLVKDIVKDRCTLIAHIGSVGTLQTIEWGQYAEQLGYDAISAVAPFYYKFSFDEIKNHYYMTVDNVDLPMIIYNFPNFSGVSLTPENIGEFLCDERFLGVKHTSSDYFAMEQFKSAFPDKMVYNGFDEMFLAGLAMGADGGIGSTYNFMAEKFIEIKAAFERNDIKTAQSIQKVVNKIVKALCKVGVTQGEKAVLTLMGIDFKDARPPFRKLTKDDYKFVEENIIPYI